MTDAPEAVALKPCPAPWCSEKYDEPNAAVVGYRGMEFVVCGHCACTGPEGSSPEEAAALWNTRPADDLVRQLVEAIDGLLNSMSRPVGGGDGQTFTMTLPSAEAWNAAARARNNARAAGYGGDHG